MTDSDTLYSWAELSYLLEQTEGVAFIAFTDRFVANVEALSKAFRKHYSNVSIGYSYKTNHLPELCKMAFKLGLYAEVVSGSEYIMAQKLGVTGDRILFNGPTKSDEELRLAFSNRSLINIDSLSEARQVLRLASEFDGDVRVGLRCNLDLAWKDRNSRFGLSEKSGELHSAAEILVGKSNIHLEGLHCHTSFDRSAASYTRRVDRLIEIADQIFGVQGPKFLDMGGGLCGRMSEDLSKQFSIQPPTFDDYADAICRPLIERYGSSGPELIVEPGVGLLGNVFDYAFRVEHVKQIDDNWFAVTSGASHHIKIVPNTFDLPTTCIQSPDVAEGIRRGTPVDIAGYTCLEHDVIYRGFKKPLAAGDILITSSVGAYSMVSSPDFIRTSPPVYEYCNDGWRILRGKVSIEDYLNNFSR
ncbi:Orn/DAP/Arg decarboxylase 2 [Methylophaga lonarensis MPL]|uniref:Orn/DAP/Arg decarboxylase 2 n=1 Tax=Methylophaga lonarensis MPL TaxID=1286106 RepID=M7P3K9_9GAMM|nr:Orn/DAP/Arg decarboxylase 2 [Methylophaga lonarensis]EMR14101.1 Orn/DAP/Arg decarboxylase 2 [Methylophaga lonarensis MPL]